MNKSPKIFIFQRDKIDGLRIGYTGQVEQTADLCIIFPLVTFLSLTVSVDLFVCFFFIVVVFPYLLENQTRMR